MGFIPFEGTWYNADVLAAKSFREFCENVKGKGLSREQMKELHDLCKKETGKKPQEKKEETPEESPDEI